MKQYIIDAFTHQVFSGNPAAICILDKWIDDELMQNIAIENSLSETAFALKENDFYHLRWFTPNGEIDLCGHATLACAYVIFHFIEKHRNEITFITVSGKLTVKKQGELYEMEFPVYDLIPVKITPQFIEALGVQPKEAYLGRDLLCILASEEDVYSVKPNIEKINDLDGMMLHVSAKGKEVDCVSRSFGPKFGIDEDPVCGSGHCHIIPYWSKTLHKNQLIAYQASKRGGMLYCRLEKERVFLAGQAVLYSISEIYI